MKIHLLKLSITALVHSNDGRDRRVFRSVSIWSRYHYQKIGIGKLRYAAIKYSDWLKLRMWLAGNKLKKSPALVHFWMKATKSNFHPSLPPSPATILCEPSVGRVCTRHDVANPLTIDFVDEGTAQSCNIKFCVWRYQIIQSSACFLYP